MLNVRFRPEADDSCYEGRVRSWAQATKIHDVPLLSHQVLLCGVARASDMDASAYVITRLVSSHRECATSADIQGLP